MGNITRTTEADGTYWDHGYDDGHGLTLADRESGNGNVAAKYRYTYDAAGNMVTKVEPFFDDFNDGNMTGWYQTLGWQVSGGALTTAADGTGHAVYVYTTDANYDLEFDYTVDDLASVDSYLAAQVRRNSTSRAFEVRFYSDRAAIYERTQQGWDIGATNPSFDTEEDATYHVKIACDGSSVKVWRWEEGELPAQVFNYTTGTYLYVDYVWFTAANLGVGLDNIRIVADDLSSTYVSTHNNANELTAMAMPNGGGTMSFAYDAWGRQTTKAWGSYSATYGYRYGSKLYSVASNFPGEGNATYAYSGRGDQRSMAQGSEIRKFRPNLKSAYPVDVEDADGNLLSTIATLPTKKPTALAELKTNGASFDGFYFLTNNAGTVRRFVDDTKTTVATAEYSIVSAEGQVTGSTDVQVYAGRMKFTGKNGAFNKVRPEFPSYPPPPMPPPPAPNHCGSGIYDVPDAPGGFDFSSCCKDHDGCYGCDGAKQGKDQDACDEDFHQCMQNTCWTRYYSEGNINACIHLADIYHDVVNRKGGSAFENGRECCSSSGRGGATGEW